MSETIAPPGEGEPPEPAATETEAPAPAAEGAATETTETTTEEPKPSRGDRRIAALSARLSAAEQREQHQAAEIEALRSGRMQQPNGELHLTPEQQAYLDQRVAAEVAHRAAQDRAQRFHAEGRAQHADWQERCSSLMQMGADAQIAELLIEMPEGVKVAAALADDPEELERIAALRTERARAIELGKYAAAKAAAPAPAPRVSRAPPPIRPVTGSVTSTFNEYTATPEQLTEHYAKQLREKRLGR